MPKIENLDDLPGLALTMAVRGFFDDGGTRCCVVNHGDGEMTGGGLGKRRGLDDLGPVDDVASLYFPWVVAPGPFGGPSIAADPCGHIAGVYARTDAHRGVHKAPANEVILGITGIDLAITAGEQGDLNSNGVNVLRTISN